MPKTESVWYYITKTLPVVISHESREERPRSQVELAEPDATDRTTKRDEGIIPFSKLDGTARKGSSDEEGIFILKTKGTSHEI